jgi:archaemetzincin
MRTPLALAAVMVLALPAFAAEPAAASGRVVAIVPFGEVDDALLRVAAESIRSRVRAEVRIDPVRPLPPEAWYAPRKRWRAEKLLAALEADPPPGAWRTVGLTRAEISTTKPPHVDWRIGGLGLLAGRSSVVSTWIFERHSRTAEILRRRLDDLVAHEFGHTLGLDHCATERCMMRDAEGKILRSVDSSTGRYCDRCRATVGEGILEPAPR